MNLKISFLLVSTTIIISCAGSKNTASPQRITPAPLNADKDAFVISETSSDESYGYTEKNAIKVGGNANSTGPLSERRFLNALAGPNGEAISYVRTGSCCHFQTPNAGMGMGLLDKYEIKWPGQKKVVTLYINMYDRGELKIPVGFTARK